MIKVLFTINRTMKRGYNFQRADKNPECLKNWMETWKTLKHFFKETGVKTLVEFDGKYELIEPLMNWSMDFQEVLRNSDRGESFVDFCNWIIPYYDKSDSNLPVIKMDLAEYFFNEESPEEGEVRFKELTENFSWYSWGWINWSRQYWAYAKGKKNYSRGEDILLEALKVKNIEGTGEIYEALQNLYEDSGQKEKAKSLEKRLKHNLKNHDPEKEGYRPNVLYGF